MVKDPVCGMEIQAKDAYATRGLNGSTAYLCSEDCAIKFDANPGKYLRNDAEEAVSATTGVRNEHTEVQRIELPVTGLGAQGAPALEQALRALVGVKRATRSIRC